MALFADTDSADPGLSAGFVQPLHKDLKEKVVKAVPDLPDDGIEVDVPVVFNRKMGIGKNNRIKSITEVDKFLEVKKLHPIKSIQEVKSIKEVKSLLKVPDEIAKRFIKVS